MKARIYTLDNGMKVYMSVDNNEPMIKAILATNAGSKNDPANATGLAHYFEHLMFKGTKQFGTKDYAKEEPLLNAIERLFEEYRNIDEKETAKRNRLFRTIDSLSQIASQYAISNEYDKLMSALGSKGTNAYTWIDFTNYIEKIPSNQLENYLIVQADRFQNPVLRTFHTELETVYEEKNMDMARDGSKVGTAMMAALYPNHPYGTQTTLGTQQHLRNPSLTNIKNFFNTYYVPNNMAFILAGDFNPDEAIVLIDKYFGEMKAKPLPEFKFTPEKPITEPIVKEVVGKQAESVSLAWRFGDANSPEIPILTLADMVLTNQHVGLVDLNVNLKQLVLGAGSQPAIMHDYSYLTMYGQPTKGQTLEEVRDILLNQIDSLQQGKFPDWLLEACINNLRQLQIKEYETADGRARAMEEAFGLDVPWKDVVNEIDELKNITKEQIMDFAKKYLRRDNYVIVYKRKGNEKIDKIKKPKVTPIKINRDNKSDFVKQIEEAAKKVTPIEPVFIDIQKDMTTTQAKNNTLVYYTKNTDNELFTLDYVSDYGMYNDKYMAYAAAYMEYLGTDKYTPEEIKQEFYKLGCTYEMSSGGNRSYVTISGLSKNMEKAMALFEEVVNNLKPNKEALKNLVNDVFQSREDAKDYPNAIFSYLVTYGVYGGNSPYKAVFVSEKELNAMTPELLIGKIQNWMKYKQYVIYYGPQTKEEVVASINKTHNLDNLKDVPPEVIFKEDVPAKTRVFVAHYEHPGQQVNYYATSFGEYYQPSLTPKINMYNSYFGGGMSSIVFQEMREARSLAYTAWSTYSTPSQKEDRYSNANFIACGVDKMKDAIEAFDTLTTMMPENEESFNTAKESLLSNYRTARTHKSRIVWTYLGWKRLNITEDPRKNAYAAIPALTLEDVKQFQKEYVTGKPQTILIMGDVNDMDMEYLKKLGKVTVLKLKDIFYY
jgi:predicted Zn-dependent peptidase